jgi:hypothetical protein
VTSIVWPAIVAALLPLELRDLVTRLPHLLKHLSTCARVEHQPNDDDDDRSHPRQVDDFRTRFILPTRGVA